METRRPKMQTASRERQARRLAERQGYILRKSRRDGSYIVIDIESNGLVSFAGGVTLDEVERWLAEPPEEGSS
jgi:hypothetical protein